MYFCRMPNEATSPALDQVRRLWQHSFWADAALLVGIRALPNVPADVLKEYGHIIAAQEVWLARLESRAASMAVWPAVSKEELVSAADRTIASFKTYLAGLDVAALSRVAQYTNTAGKSFENTVGDILLHVAMHSQYHRGKVNLLLRQAGMQPVPVDFIAFVRVGAAARLSGGTAAQ